MNEEEKTNSPGKQQTDGVGGDEETGSSPIANNVINGENDEIDIIDMHEMIVTTNKSEQRKTRALYIIIGVLCVLVIALSATLAVSAVQGQKYAKQYANRK